MVLFLVAVILFLPVEGILIVRAFILMHRFDVYFTRYYPEKAKEWQSRWPALKHKFSPGRFWGASLWEYGDMPDDETLRDLQRKAGYAVLGMPLWILAVTALSALGGVLIDAGVLR